MRRYLLPVISALAALVVFGGPAAAQEANASVVVVHGIPDTPVDVYVNDELTLDDFQPDTVTEPLSLPPGAALVIRSKEPESES